MTKKALAVLLLSGAILLVASGCKPRELSPAEVVEQADKWLNKTITIQGTAGTLWTSCTEEECTPEYPCCNACFASLALYPDADAFYTTSGQGPYAYEGNGPVIGLEFTDGEGCQGDECGLTCEPLQLGERYAVTGLLRECSSYVAWCTLEVSSYSDE